MAGGAPGTEHVTVDLLLDPRTLNLPDGRATLTISARDWSLREGFAGNRNEARVQLAIDTKPPSISVESGLTYIYRGGSAAAVYRVDSDSERDGIQVGDAFFRGYSFPLSQPQEGSRLHRIAFFAIPVEAEADPTVQVVASDLAGNQSTANFPARVLERQFPSGRISLSSRFLESVAVPLAEAEHFSSSDPISAFQQVNRDLRARNEAQILEIVAASAPELYWSQSFSQLENSEVTSRFAEKRSYFVDGEEVSHARHYGFDLASTSGAPITAANSGVVLFAGGLGIYGKTVVVDHGMGLTSLYAHLSNTEVNQGDRVQKNERLGSSGATGLAGGDHLHFAILVGHTYVDPMEWWDPRWVRSHIDAVLPRASGAARR
jgi:murein DD-endopeptidase MepM/ murein hydrolase activator NlpD